MEILNTQKTVNKVVNNKAINKAKNKAKLESKSINLLNEVKKATKKAAPTTKKVVEKSSFKTVVIGTNNIFKTNFISLGYLLKIVSNEEQQIFEEQKKNLEFNKFDEMRLKQMFNVIKLARKNSDLYKTIQSLKGITTKKGNFCIFFLLRTLNTNLIDLQKQIDLQNWK